MSLMSPHRPGVTSRSALRVPVPRLRYAVIVALMSVGLLQGCAAYQAYSRCGFHGCPGDAKITADVRTALASHPALDPPDMLRVQTLDGVVYLSGQVSTDLQREIASSVARQAAGVRRVVNSVAITYEGR